MKRNFTKPLSWLLTLAVLCSAIFAMGITANAASDTIYVNNIAMKDGQYLKENATAVTTARPGSNYAYYKGGVLNLHDFDMNWDGSSSVIGAINSGDGDLIIELYGTNTITSSVQQVIVGKDNTKLRFRGSGSLTINSSADYAISCGNLEITGSRLNVNATGKAIAASNYTHIGGTVNVQGCDSDTALMLGEMTVSGGIVNVSGKHGIVAAQGDVTVTNGRLNVTATYIGILCINIEVSGGCLDVIGNRQALMLGGKLSAKNCDFVNGAATPNAPLVQYDDANGGIYERVFIGDHECYGYTGSCQTPMKCSDCGKVFDVYADHVWTTFWDATAAEGHAHRCIFSGDGCTEHSPYENHIPGAAATETSDQICTICNYIITPRLEHTHSLKNFPAVAATCDKNGNLEYYVCSGCSKVFQDAAATKEYADANSIIIPPTGHQFAEEWSMDTTSHWHACSGCGIKEDTGTHIPGAVATDTTDQTCTVCAYVIAASHTHAFGDHSVTERPMCPSPISRVQRRRTTTLPHAPSPSPSRPIPTPMPTRATRSFLSEAAAQITPVKLFFAGRVTEPGFCGIRRSLWAFASQRPLTPGHNEEAERWLFPESAGQSASESEMESSFSDPAGTPLLAGNFPLVGGRYIRFLDFGHFGGYVAFTLGRRLRQ